MKEPRLGSTESSVTGSFDLVALGERVRRERLERNLTLDELAARAGVSRSMISAVESGGKAPTIVVLHRIASGLGIGMTRLMGESAPARIIVRRRAEQPVVTDPSGWERLNLAPAIPGLDFEFMRTTIPAGVDAGLFPPHAPGSREHIAVESGVLTLVIDGERHELAAGDSISYAADCQHQFINAHDTPCVYYLALVE
jgi:transcriptional regulator with XRE-family HTH domain